MQQPAEPRTSESTGAVPPPHPDPRLVPLETARTRAVYLFMGLIAVLALTSMTGLTAKVDTGVFATLVGGLIALLGLGSVVRLVVGGRKDDDA